LHVTRPSTTATWQQAIHQAQRLVVDPDSSSAAAAPPIDPIALVGPDLGDLKHNIGKLLSSQHPFVNTVAQHYFSGQGKHIRPLLVLLISQATSVTTQTAIRHDFETMDQPISHGLLNMTPTSLFNRQQHYTPNHTQGGCTVLPTQRRLAEITEMIHTASLLHDDVIDASLTRRNLPSANASFGNKMAVLGGDFLLARASLTLARLRNAECMEIMATCIANLVEGEFMQLKNTSDSDEDKSTFDHYMDKTYMKTGSLIAQSCKAAAVLGGCNDQVKSLAFDFGRHLGLAFQASKGRENA
jgi:hexaprenyl-diphosphate synthase